MRFQRTIAATIFVLGAGALLTSLQNRSAQLRAPSPPQKIIIDPDAWAEIDNALGINTVTTPLSARETNDREKRIAECMDGIIGLEDSTRDVCEGFVNPPTPGKITLRMRHCAAVNATILKANENNDNISAQLAQSQATKLGCE